MKYCLQYSNQCPALNKADEISIKYIEDRGLLDFLKRHSSQRVNLRTSRLPYTEIRKLLAIKKEHPEYRFAVAFIGKLDEDCHIEDLKEAGIPFYCSSPCTDWETFNSLLKIGVSDINISGPLGFELPKVKTAIAKSGREVQVRATPNLCYNLSLDTDRLVGFYIRPEDTEVYEKYIDIFDFYDVTAQNLYYTIYSKRQYLGNLTTLIYDLKTSIDNRVMTPLFGDRRTGCGRQCLSGGHCRRCYNLVKLAESYTDEANETINQTIAEAKERIENEIHSRSENN